MAVEARQFQIEDILVTDGKLPGDDTELAARDSELQWRPATEQELAETTQDLRYVIEHTRKHRVDPLDAAYPFSRKTENICGVGSMMAAAAGFATFGLQFAGVKNPDLATITETVTLGLPVGTAYLREIIPKSNLECTPHVAVPRGYGLQCFYDNGKSNSRRDRSTDVSVAILPRQHLPDEPETIMQSRERLQQAITVAYIAGANKIIIPQSILSSSGSGLIGTMPFGTLLQGMSERALVIPGGEQPSIVLEAADASKYAESLELASTPWMRILDALKRRYPQNLDFLLYAKEPEKLVPTLRRYVRYTAQEELPGARSTMWASPEKDNFVRIRESLETQLIPSDDEYDPLIRQFVQGQYAAGDDRKLSQLISQGKNLVASVTEITRRIEKGQPVGDMELLYVALQTIKRYDLTEVSDKAESEPAIGQSPCYITLENRTEKAFKYRYYARVMGKITLAMALFAPLTAYAHEVGDYLNQPPAATNVHGGTGSGGANHLGEKQLYASDQALSTDIGYADLGGGPPNPPEWKLTGFGLDPSGYYSEQIDNRLETWQWLPYWESGQRINEQLRLPMSIIDERTPHITAEQWTTADGQILLPVHTGTRIAALRITDASGKNIAYLLDRSKSGEYQLTVQNWTHAPIHIGFDMVRSDLPVEKAVAPIDIGIPFRPDRVPPILRYYAKFGPAAVARYTAGNYQYENTAALNDLVDNQPADGITRAVDHAKKCNCNVCAVTNAIADAAVHDRQPLAVASGFNVHSVGNDAYILSADAHAFMLDGSGNIIDGTPEGSLNVRQVSQQRLDAMWQKMIPKKSSSHAAALPERHFPNPKYPLMAIGLLGLAALEIRNKNVKRLAVGTRDLLEEMAATRHVPPADSHRMLQWGAWGGDKSKQPQISGIRSTTSIHELAWYTIPESALRDAAVNGITRADLTRRQRKSVQKTAAYVLNHQRRYGRKK